MRRETRDPGRTPGDDRVNILVVDDQPDKLLVLVSILEELGQNVIAARSGSEALQEVLARDFAVILLDVNMPGMDGYETASLIRNRKRSAHVPIIFITSYADEIHTAHGYSLGAADYVLSPIAPEILRTKVGVFVELFRMAEQTKLHADQRIALAEEQAARRAAERVAEALRQSEERFRLASEAVTGFIYEVDLGTGATTVSSGLSSLLGFPPEEAQTPGWWEQRVHPDDLSSVRPFGEAGESTYRSEYRVHHRDGHLIAVWDQGIVVHDEQGRAVRLVGNVVDITERKLAEEGLAESNRRKDEFLAMLAHELRNPLAPIRNAVEVLRADLSEPVLHKCREIIERQVVHMSRLLDDLLDVSRISRGTPELRKERVSIAEVIHHAVDATRPWIDAKGQQLRVETTPGLVLEADAARLTQVFANLLSNATKYTGPGGEIRLVCERAGTELVVQVRDTGIGIPADMLTQIFVPFVQVDRSLQRSEAGLGIGLTLVQRLVELHGGSVEASSAGLGLGSEFVVRLPGLIAAPMPTPSPQPNGPDRPTTRPRRIVVVDDTPDNADSLGMILSLLGHEVRVTYTGEDGLDLAHSFAPEIVLLDLGMPRVSGYEVARRIREQPWGRSLTLIAVSGWGQESDRRLTHDAGFDHHLVKPVVVSELATLLDAAPTVAPSDAVTSQPAS